MKTVGVLFLLLWLGELVAAMPAPAENATAGNRNGRVVSLSPIITETIYLLGAESSLLANTQYCNVPPEAAAKEKIGSVTQVNVEKIVSLGPDLVITSALTREKQIRILRKQGLRVMEIRNPQTFGQMCGLTLDIGRALGRPGAAGEIVARAGAGVRMVQNRVAGLPAPRVFIQIGLKPLHTVNKELFIHEYIVLSNAVNIAGNAPSGIYSREKVLQENPDIILIATMGTSKTAGILEKKRWMGFRAMKAAADGRIHVLDPEIICSPTPVSFARGLARVASLIHPEAGIPVPDIGTSND